MSIQMTSPAFEEGGAILRQYTCDGANISPPLKWSGVPPGAQSLALIMDDPDAPAGTWVHWVVYGIPGSAIALPENVPTREKLDDGTIQGVNDFRKTGYGGPCPPRGSHRYYFKLYALDTSLNLKPGATKAELLKIMEGHLLAHGQLMGRYQRL